MSAPHGDMTDGELRNEVGKAIEPFWWVREFLDDDSEEARAFDAVSLHRDGTVDCYLGQRADEERWRRRGRAVSESFDLGRELERIDPSSLAAHIDPSRPYDGQPHTDTGERGRTEVKGITFRDLRDCFIRACYESSGLPIEEWPGSVYDLPWTDMDILAVTQNLACNVEKAMGIYPNIPRLLPADPSEMHWCGWPIDRAVWTSHDGPCP